METTPAQRFCNHLHEIVVLMESGDHRAAAKLAAELPGLVASLPPTMSADEVALARRWLDRYGELGAQLQDETAKGMQRLGAARRVQLYGRRG